VHAQLHAQLHVFTAISRHVSWHSQPLHVESYISRGSAICQQ